MKQAKTAEEWVRKNLGMDPFRAIFKVLKPADITIPVKGRIGELCCKYPYWKFNTDSLNDEVKQMYSEGTLVIEHMFFPGAFRATKGDVAMLFRRGIAGKANTDDWDAWNRIDEGVLKELEDESNKISKSKKLQPGFIFSFPVADGVALYMVTKVNKKTAGYIHLRFGDGYAERMLDAIGTIPIDKLMQVSRFGKPPLFSRLRPLPKE